MPTFKAVFLANTGGLKNSLQTDREQVAGVGFGGPLIYYSINKLENFRRTENREQTDRQTEISFTEAALIPCGSLG